MESKRVFCRGSVQFSKCPPFIKSPCSPIFSTENAAFWGLHAHDHLLTHQKDGSHRCFLRGTFDKWRGVPDQGPPSNATNVPTQVVLLPCNLFLLFVARQPEIYPRTNVIVHPWKWSSNQPSHFQVQTYLLLVSRRVNSDPHLQKLRNFHDFLSTTP